MNNSSNHINNIEIRPYTSADCTEMAQLFVETVQLFVETVHTVCAKDYPTEQLDAWTGHMDLERWNRSFLAHDTLVAVTDGKVVGFGDIDKTGYLDRLYVHKDYQRQGIATALCDCLETMHPFSCITTHASITAQPFFEKRGYRVINPQLVERDGLYLRNFVMEKII